MLRDDYAGLSVTGRMRRCLFSARCMPTRKPICGTAHRSRIQMAWRINRAVDHAAMEFARLSRTVSGNKCIFRGSGRYHLITMSTYAWNTLRCGRHGRCCVINAVPVDPVSWIGAATWQAGLPEGGESFWGEHTGRRDRCWRQSANAVRRMKISLCVSFLLAQWPRSLSPVIRTAL